MGLFIHTAAGLMLIYGGTYGLDVLFSRFATPEARAAHKVVLPPADDGQVGDGESH
jgi:hypothetical protein